MVDDVSLMLNQTFIRCLQKFSLNCFPSCGHLQSRDILSACINISVQSTIEWIQYNLDELVNNQYEPDLAIPFYGYITPVLAIITVLFNSFIFYVLSKKSMRSPTNLILFSIAFCDTVTILSPLTWYLHTYAADGYQEYPIYSWCIIYRYFGVLIPTCFHNSAVWFTVMLSIHRYIGISHPKLARVVCSYRAVTKGIFCIFVLLIIFIFSQLIFEKMEKVIVIGKQILDTQGVVYVETCHFKASPNVYQNTYVTYFRVYPCLRIVLCNIVPCILLIVFNTLLIRKTYQSYNYRKKLLKGSIKSQHLEITEIVRTTVMLISVCFLTLLVEIPNGILFSVHVVHSLRKISLPNIKIWLTFPNFILFLTYPVNFILYSTMNRRFRRHLYNIFCKRRQRRRSIYSVSCSFDIKLTKLSTQDLFNSKENAQY